jgi:hypothetical protein
VPRIVVIDAASDAKASGVASRIGMPELSSGRLVRPLPKKNARTTDNAIEATFPHPHHVLRIIPSTSPIAGQAVHGRAERQPVQRPACWAPGACA